MAWKNWPYWLRGGVIGVLFLIMALLLLSMIQIFKKGGCAFYGSHSISLCFYFSLMFLWWGAIPAFGIGALIGWIVRKIRNIFS